jgi:hypothetical protein
MTSSLPHDDVRDELVRSFSTMIVGPVAEDEVIDAAPSDTYLTGVLWPRGSPLAGDQDDAGTAELAGADPDAPDSPVPGYRSIRPCSIGITLSVRTDAVLEISLAGTARYERFSPPEAQEGRLRKIETAADDAGPSSGDAVPQGVPGDPAPRNRDRWKRIPLEYSIKLPVGAPSSSQRVDEFVTPGGHLIRDPGIALDIKRRVKGDIAVLTITLINTAPEADTVSAREALSIFQSVIRVTATDSGGRPAILPRETHSAADDEDALTNLLLYRGTREYASGHGVSAQWPAPQEGTVPWVSTTWLPKAAVSGTSPDGHQALQGMRKRESNPFSAFWLSREDARPEICATLEEFCQLYARWIENELVRRLPDFDGGLRRAADQNVEKCQSTLRRMRRGVDALRKSDAAWVAFALANSAMDRQARYPSKGDRAGPLVWRPFQLAFLLLVVPSIADPGDADRGTMDLLWFPTGGGKTEAYLALTAFQIFHRRLTSQFTREHGGIDVLMRYTLRLLTVQQFQRAAALIAACDQIRAEHSRRLGSAQISLGLYVGGDSTPNRLEEARAALEEERGGGSPPSTPRQLLACPVCGGVLGPSAYRVLPAAARIEVRCGAGGCEARGEPLPVLTVDESIYAHPPSLLIGTVDKFAQLPRRTDLRNLFGLGTPERPGLIIQDELHLISGPLGSMAGLYEAGIDLLCSSGGVRPKIVGSTATIGRARRQVRALFDRDVLQFPPPGFDAGDSFFSVRDDNGPDRIYVGVSSAGRSPKFALQAVLGTLMQSVAALREARPGDEEAIDPYWTCVAYFNSLRELGGAHVLMLDDVPRTMKFVARRLGVNRRTVEEAPVELSSRVPSNRIPEVLKDIGRSIGSDDPYEPDAVNAVLASNMISVGVDVPRLGLMVVNGQPKSTAEYIQATSRVGRGLPGLVVTVCNFGRPRDVSHLEHFQAYHSALYRAVEATSVTPWASRARDKALHAVFAGTVRHLLTSLLEDEDAINFDPSEATISAVVEYLVARAGSGTDDLERADTAADLRRIIATWQRRAAQSRAEGRKLRYWERRARYGQTSPHLMRAAEQMKGSEGSAWPTPNSMREVEPSTAFVLKRLRPRTKPEGGDGSAQS